VVGVDVWEEPGVAGQEMGPGSVNCFVPVIVFSAFAPLSAGAVAPRPGAHQRERMALGSILAQGFCLSNHCIQRATDGQAAPVEDGCRPTGTLVMVIFFRQDGGQPVWPLGADGIDGAIGTVLHFAPRRYCGLNASGIY
jgi:hypothetical protein